MAKLKAIVVEDDKQYCERFSDFLKMRFGCDVVMSFSGADAIAVLDKEKFEIMLLDLKMPGIDGFTVLAHALKVNPSIIPVVISGVTDDSIADKAEAMGAWFMSKPVELKALEYVLNSLMKKQKLIP